jgi:hypothetical protein
MVKRVPIVPFYICALVAWSFAACSPEDATGDFGAVVTRGDTVTMSAVAGALIARDSLTAADASPLPCCSQDSAGVHSQVTAGTMRFYAATTYAETVFTPAGPRPNACVQGVPNGSFLALNNLLTLPDGENYLLMPCTAGFYNITLTERLSYADGSSAIRQVTLSSGRYGWQRDLISFKEQGSVGSATASMLGATITVTVSGHRYVFLAVPR